MKWKLMVAGLAEYVTRYEDAHCLVTHKRISDSPCTQVLKPTCLFKI